MAEAPSAPGSEEQEELLVEESTGLTTQWSVEDEKEVARERRRRERDRQLQAQDQDESGHSPGQPEQEALLKPSETPELDEDEGFGDWSQKPEQHQQQFWGTKGSVDSCKPPWGTCPEGEQEEDRQVGVKAWRPCQCPCENDNEGGRFCHTEAHLEGLCLDQKGPGPEEEPIQDHLGAAETGEAEEEHQKCLPPRTPSPLALEGTTELRSPPLSPTAKVGPTLLLSSNSVKKSQPALPISKIDERLEQYTQAIESAGWTPKLSRQASIELPSMAVANTKSRWETGEVQTQSASKTPSCKDIVAGDLSKKSLWEKKGDSKTSSTVKSTPSGKRYKFVATGHGKYEKVFLDEGSAP
ncbi:Lymphocyte-specific protein 1 [Heterocephalus glaber]|uniref:Lymphocyte-specific protein 1 n=1 Tax=Heterocephalus glaber TaxID=10181 RepID=G5C2F8_HETGA|nr:Lymphocyte-specific protein 1 [Heterocephalus glaber]